MKRISFAAYLAWNYDKEVLALNRKSERGWQLIRGGCFCSKFEKDLSHRYVYQIDYNPGIRKRPEETERYIDMFACQGWEFINITFNGWVYFRRLYEENISSELCEIYTDEASYLAMLERWIMFARIAQVIEFVCCITQLYVFSKVRDMECLWVSGFAICALAFIQWGIGKMRKKTRHK